MPDGYAFPAKHTSDMSFGIYRYQILYRFEVLWLTARGREMPEPTLELQLDPASHRSGRLQELNPSQAGRLIEFGIVAAKQVPDVDLCFNFSRYELSKIRDSLCEG